MTCPNCGATMDALTLDGHLGTYDQQRNTRFQYLRCPKDHGRLIAFVEFLREKDFIRPLSAPQIEELRRSIQIVNCSNCGAPIDLTKSSSCGGLVGAGLSAFARWLKEHT